MKSKIAQRKEFAETVKKSDAEKAEKLKRQVGLRKITAAPTDKTKRIKSQTRNGMRIPPVDMSDRAEFFKDCKPSEVHARKLEYQTYCEEVFGHPRRVSTSRKENAAGKITERVQCQECGKVLS